MSEIIQLSELLIKEKIRLYQMNEECIKELKNLPKGAIGRTKTKFGDYFYLVTYNKESGKHTSRYIGKDESAIPIIKEQIERGR